VGGCMRRILIMMRSSSERSTFFNSLLVMIKGDDARSEELRRCHHNRMLEGVRDHQGKKTDLMKCCECGALVPRPSHKAILESTPGPPPAAS
jgi:hypothetical protein